MNNWIIFHTRQLRIRTANGEEWNSEGERTTPQWLLRHFDICSATLEEDGCIRIALRVALNLRKLDDINERELINIHNLRIVNMSKRLLFVEGTIILPQTWNKRRNNTVVHKLRIV